MRHTKLSNNPNSVNAEGNVDSIEIVEEKKVDKVYNSAQNMLKSNNEINDENNINNIQEKEDNIEKIDEESLHSNHSYVRGDSLINNKIYESNDDNNIQEDKNQEEIKDEDIKEENEPKNDLILDEEENDNSKNNRIDNLQGMSEKNY